MAISNLVGIKSPMILNQHPFVEICLRDFRMIKIIEESHSNLQMVSLYADADNIKQHLNNTPAVLW